MYSGKVYEIMWGKKEVKTMSAKTDVDEAVEFLEGLNIKSYDPKLIRVINLLRALEYEVINNV